MDLKDERNPYYRLRNEDPIDWHLWTRSTVELARRQNKDLRVVIGSYYSQDAHFLEKTRYRDAEFATSLNETYINVIVDRDELPAFEHLYRSIAIWVLSESEASEVLYSYANLPLVLVLDNQALFPKVLRNESIAEDIGVLFDADPMHKLIAAKSDVGHESQKVIQFPQQRKSDLEIPFQEYMDKLFEREPGVTLESIEQLRQELEAIRSDTHPTGSYMMANVVRHGKVADYVMHDARLRFGGVLRGLDLAIVMLTRLAQSVYFDPLAGGFFQSRLEATSQTPVAVKRLTVSACLLEVYCKALSTVDDPLFEYVVRLTADYLSDQITEEDTFPTTVSDLSRSDASHYAWNRLSLKRLLTEDEFVLIETMYGLDLKPNYQKSYLLELQDSWYSVVDRLNLEPDQALALYESARQKMLEARNDSELVADDRVDPLACAAVSKALVIAATTLSDPAYFETAKRVLDSIVEKFDPISSEGRFDTSGSKGIRLKPVDALFIIDALLALIEYEWDSRSYEVATSLWDFVLAIGLDDTYHIYCKPQFFGAQRPSEFTSVPDFAPIFDYQSDRLAETTVFMEVARKLSNLEFIDYFWDLFYYHVEALEMAIDRHDVEHIECLHQIGYTEIYHASIVLRGPIDKCMHWKANIRIPPDIDCPIYVIPYDPEVDMYTLPEYLQTKTAKNKSNRVTAFVCEQSDKLRQFTNLMKLNDHLWMEDVQ